MSFFGKSQTKKRTMRKMTVLFLVDELSYWAVLGQRELVSLFNGNILSRKLWFWCGDAEAVQFCSGLSVASESRQRLEAGDHVE